MWTMEVNEFGAAEKLLRGALEVRTRRLGPEHARHGRYHDTALPAC
jgi:hypothetical protein